MSKCKVYVIGFDVMTNGENLMLGIIMLLAQAITLPVENPAFKSFKLDRLLWNNTFNSIYSKE
ncbi:4889_t:CDS:2 [Funneliformis mosseae]|uniref:4889_t:CDS:1 n=1 Tax=Funneliformis mosseae TaxID=27381 RepID=A0A9N9FU88_FUNMO|nr:4889_t:CDS:2 [Funneliformis mosseae]